MRFINEPLSLKIFNFFPLLVWIIFYYRVSTMQKQKTKNPTLFITADHTVVTKGLTWSATIPRYTACHENKVFVMTDHKWFEHLPKKIIGVKPTCNFVLPLIHLTAR